MLRAVAAYALCHPWKTLVYVALVPIAVVASFGQLLVVAAFAAFVAAFD